MQFFCRYHVNPRPKRHNFVPWNKMEYDILFTMICTTLLFCWLSGRDLSIQLPPSSARVLAWSVRKFIFYCARYVQHSTHLEMYLSVNFMISTDTLSYLNIKVGERRLVASRPVVCVAFARLRRAYEDMFSFHVPIVAEFTVADIEKWENPRRKRRNSWKDLRRKALFIIERLVSWNIYAWVPLILGLGAPVLIE